MLAILLCFYCDICWSYRALALISLVYPGDEKQAVFCHKSHCCKLFLSHALRFPLILFVSMYTKKTNQTKLTVSQKGDTSSWKHVPKHPVVILEKMTPTAVFFLPPRSVCSFHHMGRGMAGIRAWFQKLWFATCELELIFLRCTARWKSVKLLLHALSGTCSCWLIVCQRHFDSSNRSYYVLFKLIYAQLVNSEYMECNP